MRIAWIEDIEELYRKTDDGECKGADIITCANFITAIQSFTLYMLLSHNNIPSYTYFGRCSNYFHQSTLTLLPIVSYIFTCNQQRLLPLIVFNFF